MLYIQKSAGGCIEPHLGLHVARSLRFVQPCYRLILLYPTFKGFYGLILLYLTFKVFLETVFVISIFKVFYGLILLYLYSRYFMDWFCYIPHSKYSHGLFLLWPTFKIFTWIDFISQIHFMIITHSRNSHDCFIIIQIKFC